MTVKVQWGIIWRLVVYAWLISLVTENCATSAVTALAVDQKYVFEGIALESFAWARTDLIEDTRLAQALGIAYYYSPDWRQTADLAAERNVPIKWTDAIDKKSATLARTRISSEGLATIEIRRDLHEQSLAFLSATIVHESWHAVYGQSCTYSTDRLCLKKFVEEEATAFALEASVYNAIPDRFKSNSNFDKMQKEIVKRWQEKSLNEFVLSMSGYQSQVFGEPLVVR